MPRCATPSSSSPSSQTPVVVCPQPWPTILEGDAVLASQVAPQDPARAIVDAARSGELTVYKRDTLVNEAALAQMRATYAGDLRRRIEPLMVAAFHRALDDGAADEILDSLRPSFDQAAEAIAKAKSLGINAESSTEHIISSGEPELVTSWQQLDGHLATVNAIAAIASQFGCRMAKFPLISEYANSDGFRLDDRAIVATDGPNLEADSALFKAPDQGHRSSPFFRLPLRLHTVASMRNRYRIWAASEWERTHSGRALGGWMPLATCERWRASRTLMRQSNPRRVDPGGSLRLDLSGPPTGIASREMYGFRDQV